MVVENFEEELKREEKVAWHTRERHPSKQRVMCKKAQRQMWRYKLADLERGVGEANEQEEKEEEQTKRRVEQFRNLKVGHEA